MQLYLTAIVSTTEMHTNRQPRKRTRKEEKIAEPALKDYLKLMFED